MRHLSPFLVAVLAIGAITVPTAGAQTRDDLTPEFVQNAIERTDLRIEQAEAIVMGTDNELAMQHLQAAIDLQARAKTAFAAMELAIAARLTFDARGHADRAIAIIKNLPDPDRVRAQLERTRELLERARERIEECNNDRARSQLRMAFELQSRAEEAALNGRYLVALQLTVNARERARNALRLCNLEENMQEAAERAIMRTDHILTRARTALEDCTNDAGLESLRRGMELQDQAKAEFAAEHYRASLSLTLAARRAAYRAVRLCGRDVE